MQIQMNTDRHVSGDQEMSTKLKHQLEKALTRFSDHITRLEVHLGDENGSKSGKNDKRCVLEARLKSRQPIAVSALSPSLEQAATSAIEKMKRMLDTTLSK